jgi:hypothetical protein
MEHELQRFQQLFANEAYLRNSLATIFRSIPGIHDVQVMRGTQEPGNLSMVFAAQSNLVTDTFIFWMR